MVRLIHLIAAARPNFMKVSPLYHALSHAADFDPVLIHTGQHYDANMSDNFFKDLSLPPPAYHLGIGSGSHAEQTGGVMIAYEKICTDKRPDWIIVVGDVNSTAACAQVGAKLWINVAHLEAGLRSGDRHMPEEINRLITDAISDVLWTPSPDASKNLLGEGTDPKRITHVGNIMIDSYELMRDKIAAEDAPGKFGLQPRNYGVITLHRPSNVDDQATLSLIAEHIKTAAQRISLIFPVHPRTRKQLVAFGLWEELVSTPGLMLEEPLGYRAFMSLVSNAKFVLTDSGGVQEETTYLDIPCLTLRDNTERPITITEGTNRLLKPGEISKTIDEVLAGRWRHGIKPKFWDGSTAERVVNDLRRRSQKT